MADAGEKIIIYGHQASRASRPYWLLREYGMKINEDFIEVDTGGPVTGFNDVRDSEEFLALNPHARIPVIRDANGIFYESNTILRYLAAVYGKNSLWSQDPAERAHAEAWMDWELCKLQPDFLELFWSYYRTPENARDRDVIEAAAARLYAHFRLLDDHLRRQPYLGGERLSVGDISCGVCMYRYFEMGYEVECPEHVMQWYERLARRPAYRQAVMRAFEELYGRTDY